MKKAEQPRINLILEPSARNFPFGVQTLRSLSETSYESGREVYNYRLYPTTPVSKDTRPHLNIKTRLADFAQSTEQEVFGNTGTCHIEFGGLSFRFETEKQAQKLFDTLTRLKQTPEASKLEAVYSHYQGKYYVSITPASTPMFLKYLGWQMKERGFAQHIRDLGQSQRCKRVGIMPKMADANAKKLKSDELNPRTYNLVDTADKTEELNPKQSFSSKQLLTALIGNLCDPTEKEAAKETIKRQKDIEKQATEALTKVLAEFIPAEHQSKTIDWFSGKGAYQPLEQGWWSELQAAALLSKARREVTRMQTSPASLNDMLHSARQENQRESFEQLMKLLPTEPAPFTMKRPAEGEKKALESYNKLKAKYDEAYIPYERKLRSFKKHLTRSITSRDGFVDVSEISKKLQNPTTSEMARKVLDAYFPVTPPTYIMDMRYLIDPAIKADAANQTAKRTRDSIPALFSQYANECPAAAIDRFIDSYPLCAALFKSSHNPAVTIEQNPGIFIGCLTRTGTDSINGTLQVISNFKSTLVSHLERIAVRGKSPHVVDILKDTELTRFLQESEKRLVRILKAEMPIFYTNISHGFQQAVNEHDRKLREDAPSFATPFTAAQIAPKPAANVLPVIVEDTAAKVLPVIVDLDVDSALRSAGKEEKAIPAAPTASTSKYPSYAPPALPKQWQSPVPAPMPTPLPAKPPAAFAPLSRGSATPAQSAAAAQPESSSWVSKTSSRFSVNDGKRPL